MLNAPYFQNPFFQNRYFIGLFQEEGSIYYYRNPYTSSPMFRTQFFGLVNGISTVDMTLSLSTTVVGNPITITVSVTDGNGDPVTGAAVVLSSSDPMIASVPGIAFTNSLGQAVVTTMTTRVGSTLIRATYNGTTTGQTLTTTSYPGSVTSGTYGGGVTGPLPFKVTKTKRIWPTR